MAEIIKVYKEHLPALRFIGKRYLNGDRGADGGYSNKWGEWFEKGYFEILEKQTPIAENDDAYLGLMSHSGIEGFAYWIGMFFPAGSPVPEGFESTDIPEGDVGICWIYGKEKNDNIYGMHEECMKKLKENGMGDFRSDFNGSDDKWYWFFERYNCPRFTTPDENGKIILDYGMYIV